MPELIFFPSKSTTLSLNVQFALHFVCAAAHLISRLDFKSEFFISLKHQEAVSQGKLNIRASPEAVFTTTQWQTCMTNL